MFRSTHGTRRSLAGRFAIALALGAVAATALSSPGMAAAIRGGGGRGPSGPSAPSTGGGSGPGGGSAMSAYIVRLCPVGTTCPPPSCPAVIRCPPKPKVVVAAAPQTYPGCNGVKQAQYSADGRYLGEICELPKRRR